MSSDDVSNLISNLNRLRVSHTTQLASLLNQQQQEHDDLIAPYLPSPPSSSPTVARGPATNGTTHLHSPKLPTKITHWSRNKYPLVKGSPVKILTTAKVGKEGDTAIVRSLSDTSEFVSLRLDSTGRIAQRYAENLDYHP